jgi:hypothetical protein
MQLNAELKQTLERYKKTKRTEPVPLTTQEFISAILKLIPNQPDILIDVTLLRFIFLFPDFIYLFINTIHEHIHQLQHTYGGVVFHIQMKDVTLANIHKYGLPLIQIYNRMLEQGKIDDLTHVVKSVCCYFSSDVIRSILNLIKPLLNPQLIEVIRVFSKQESLEYLPVVISKLN